MKTPVLLCPIGAILLATAPASHAVITSFSTGFNGVDATSFTDYYLGASANPVAGAAWAADAGVGGTGGVRITNTGQSNFYYRPTPASDATAAFNISGLSAGQGLISTADFHWSNSSASELTVINLGFSATNSSASALSSNGSIGGSIIRNTSGGITTTLIRLRTANANTSTLAFDQSTLVEGNWYRLSFQAVKSATTDTFNSIVTLYSIGADGLSTPLIFNDGTKDIVLSGALSGTTISALYSDTAAYAVYDIRNTNGIDAVDNLNVVSIPEAGSAALVALGMMGLGIRRRG